MSYIITKHIEDPWHRVLAKPGTKVIKISDHAGVWIVENLKGERFPVRSEFIRDDPDNDKDNKKKD